MQTTCKFFFFNLLAIKNDEYEKVWFYKSAFKYILLIKYIISTLFLNSTNKFTKSL